MIASDITGEGYNWSVNKWKKIVNLKVRHLGWGKWRNAMESKSTLEWYKEKLTPRYERFYDGTWGSELLFKARCQSLELNDRTYRWNVDRSRLCKMCNNGEIESVSHMVVECERYIEERRVLIEAVKNEIGGSMAEEWHVDERRSMCMLFGLTDEINIRVIEAVKEFLVSVWNKRNLPLSREWMVEHEDHAYVSREQ